jgi:saposin
MALSHLCIALVVALAVSVAAEQQPTEVGNSTVCLICEFLLKEVTSKLPANFTEQQLRTELDSLCTDLGKLSPECDALVLLYGTDIYNDLTGKVPPEEVCSHIHLCPSAVPEPETTEVEAPESGLPCLICEIAMEQVAANLNKENFTYAELAQELDAACAKMPSVAKECDALVLLFGKDIYNALTGGVPAGQVCDYLHICNNATVVAEQQPQSAGVQNEGNTVVCSLCEFLLEEVASKLPSNYTLQQLDAFLDQECSSIGKLKDACDALVLLYGEDIFNALTGDIPPEQVCETIKVCPSAAVEAEPLVEEPVPEVQNEGNTVVCSLCEFLLEEVASKLPSNYTLQELDAFLDQECTDLGKLKDACDALVLLYGDDIYKALTGNIPPQQVCETIKLCSNSSEPVSTMPSAVIEQEIVVPESDAASTPELGNSTVCLICEFLLKEVTSKLPANFTVQQLRTELDSLCTDLGKLSPECDALVLLYATDIYNDLTGKVPPEQVCTDIHLCSSSVSISPVVSLIESF